MRKESDADAANLAPGRQLHACGIISHDRKCKILQAESLAENVMNDEPGNSDDHVDWYERVWPLPLIMEARES